MAPRIKESEIHLASRDGEPVGGEDVFVKLIDGQVIIKAFVGRCAGQITAQSANNGGRYVHQDEEVLLVNPQGIHSGSAVRKRQ